MKKKISEKEIDRIIISEADDETKWETEMNNDPGKLAAWLSASHVEKAPKKKDQPTP